MAELKGHYILGRHDVTGGDSVLISLDLARLVRIKVVPGSTDR